MDAPNPAESIPAAKTISIKNIELGTLVRRKLPVARQFYLRVSVGDESRSTRNAKEVNNRTSWDEPLFFDVDDHSVLVIKVYQKHRIGKDGLIGILTDSISGVLGKLKDGVLEDWLPNDTPDGSDLPGITIKFTMDALLRGDVNADEIQATDAVRRAAEALNAANPSPAALGLLNSAADAGENVVNEGQMFEILLEKMKLFDKIVTGIAQIHPYASLAWSVISAANQVLIRQKNRDDRIDRLAGTMSDVFSFVKDAEPLKIVEAHISIITLLVQQVAECGYFITDYAKQKNFWIRTAKYTISDIEARIEVYENKFRELKTAFLEGVVVQTEIAVVRMMNVVDATAESIVLDDMPYAFGARFQREKGCLPGTRESFLQEICDILNSPDENAPRVCLLTGVAGSGKSAIAHSIARLYDGQKRLGSSYCFARTDIATRNPKNLFSTIARDLSDHDPQYKTALWGIVKDDRALRTSQSPAEQVERLIIEPSKLLHPIGPLVIVIDALDESGDQASRRQLLRVLSVQITEGALPANLRFFITARQESDIIAAFLPGPHVVHKQMGDIPDKIIDQDIAKFIYHSLRYITELDSSWPDQEWCKLLVRHSDHLFQWASTACSFIEGEGTAGLDPSERLDQLLQVNSAEGGHRLDNLYKTILNQLFTLDGARDRFRMVMGIVLALHDPLSITSLSALFGKDLNVRAIIKPMGSLLDGVFDEGRPIRPLHNSFRDFLLDETRSSVFHVPILPKHSLHLGQALLACMCNMLRFNICDIKDSRIHNSAVPGLPAKVKKAIPPHLAYSCQYWMHHMKHANCTSGLLHDITLFFISFFPYWLEVISLLSLFSPLSPILSALETCKILKQLGKDQEIGILASEAFQFIQVFSPVLRGSTPHLYLSAMPQTPSSSPLCKLWLHHLQTHDSVTLGFPTVWPAEIYTLQGHTDTVFSVACSPDGVHIASGSQDSTVRVWDTTTGQCVAGPFQGHTGVISSIAYSPHGTHITSGSWDYTIIVWNVTTGQIAAGPFKGHGSRVNCVAFSPDGAHITSGSADKTIRVWDVISGQCVVGPFKGHTHEVCSVAYSPDGAHVVSGSQDKTIRVWDVVTGQCVARPLTGPNIFWSVACSPDGKQIASGCWDKTVRIWAMSTGHSVGEPFQGHVGRIFSVAYSPDGKHVTSGSKDPSIRIWDVTSGQCVADPLQGHTGPVFSVAYSPDGTHIISGSGDKTVKVWNANIGISPKKPPIGHTDMITSVSFSPDSIHFASGSWDKTIRIWDTITGQCVAGPFKEHTACVWSVAYSPDGIHVVSGSGDNTIRIWNTITGQCVTGPLQGHMDQVYCVSYSPNGTHIISGSVDMTVRVWDVTSGQCTAGPFVGHKSVIFCIACSPDGIHVTSGSADKTMRIWDVTTGHCVAVIKGHTDEVRSIAYSPDGIYIVSGSEDRTIRLWNVTTGQCVAGPLEGHTDSIFSVVYFPNGKYIASGSLDKTIRVWDANTGECVGGPFQGHNDVAYSIACSPDGNYLVSGSFDKSIKVWKTSHFGSFGDFHEEDGWISSSNIGYICWMAPWNRNAFQLAIHSLVISSHPIYQVDISSRPFFGESWTSCWN